MFCCKFDNEGRYLACGFGDGFTRLYNMETGKLGYTLHGLPQDDEVEMPVTALAWRPQSA